MIFNDKEIDRERPSSDGTLTMKDMIVMLNRCSKYEELCGARCDTEGGSIICNSLDTRC